MSKKIILFLILSGMFLVATSQIALACNSCNIDATLQSEDIEVVQEESYFSQFTKDGSELFISFGEQLIVFLMSDNEDESFELTSNSKASDLIQFAPSIYYHLKNNITLQAGFQKSLLEAVSSEVIEGVEKKGDQITFGIQYRF